MACGPPGQEPEEAPRPEGARAKGSWVVRVRVWFGFAWGWFRVAWGWFRVGLGCVYRVRGVGLV